MGVHPHALPYTTALVIKSECGIIRNEIFIIDFHHLLTQIIAVLMYLIWQIIIIVRPFEFCMKQFVKPKIPCYECREFSTKTSQERTSKLFFYIKHSIRLVKVIYKTF